MCSWHRMIVLEAALLAWFVGPTSAQPLFAERPQFGANPIRDTAVRLDLRSGWERRALALGGVVSVAVDSPPHVDVDTVADALRCFRDLQELRLLRCPPGTLGKVASAAPGLRGLTLVALGRPCSCLGIDEAHSLHTLRLEAWGGGEFSDLDALRRAKSVKRVELSGIDHEVALAIRAMPGVQEVSLEVADDVGAETWDILRTLPLCAVTLFMIRETSSVERLASLPSLRYASVDLTGLSHRDEATAIERLVEIGHRPTMQELAIRVDRPDVALMRRILAVPSLVGLGALVLDAVDALSGARKLRWLYIGAVDAAGLADLPQLPALEQVSLGDGAYVSAHFSCLRKMPALRVLHARNVDGRALGYLAAPDRLQRVQLFTLDDDGARALEGCASLRSVKVHCASTLSGAALATAINRMPLLETLSVGEADRVDDIAIDAIAAHPRLRRVSIDSPNISQRAALKVVGSTSLCDVDFGVALANGERPPYTEMTARNPAVQVPTTYPEVEWEQALRFVGSNQRTLCVRLTPTLAVRVEGEGGVAIPIEVLPEWGTRRTYGAAASRNLHWLAVWSTTHAALIELPTCKMLACYELTAETRGTALAFSTEGLLVGDYDGWSTKLSDVGRRRVTSDRDDALWDRIGAADPVDAFGALREWLDRDADLSATASRLHAAKALTPEALKPLIDQLSDANAGRRDQALRLLTEEAGAVRDFLARQAEQATDKGLRSQLATALGPRSVVPLASSGGPFLRALRLIDALGWREDERARRLLDDLARGADGHCTTSAARGALLRKSADTGSAVSTVVRW